MKLKKIKNQWNKRSYVIKNIIILTGLIVLLQGCAREPIRIANVSYADTTKISQGFPMGTSFSMIGSSYVAGIEQKNELLTKELEQKISLILNQKGYLTRHPQEAEYYIVFNYGIKSDTKVINTPKYIPGQTYTTYGTVNGTYGNYGQYNETVNSTGTYVYMPEEYTFHTKFLCFYIYDAKQSKNMIDNQMPPQIWHGLCWGVDNCSDLRAYLDFLIIDLCNSLGKNSPGTIRTKMDVKNKSVLWLRNTYFNMNNASK